MLEKNIVRMYESGFRENAALPALSDYFKPEDSFTYLEMSREIARVHLLYRHLGIGKGDKVALLGRNNPRWCIAYVATITYGAVIVPILQDFTANDVHHIINHSDSRLLFCGDTFWDSIEPEQLPAVEAAFSLTDFGLLYDRDAGLTPWYSDINGHFRDEYPEGFGVGDIRFAEVQNGDMVLLSYTSGTTGFSKGVMLSCNNLTGNVAFCIDRNIRARGSNVLSFLPLAHAYGCTVDLLLSLAVGAHLVLLGKTPAPKLIMEAMAKVRPEIVCCVPLIIEKVCRKQVFPAIGRGFMKLALKVPVIDAKIYAGIRKKLLDVFGGNVNEFIVGGAPLNREVEDFLLKIKFPFTVGYGMTECAPLISFQHTSLFKPTSCGMVLHGYMEARVESPDPRTGVGEIVTRGENVMLGYYKNPPATAEMYTADGWLRTGDMGTMDADGTIYIRGRSKSMLLGANGQNIYPEEIESKLNNLYCVNESLVVERDGRLVALVVPDYEQADADGFNGDKLPEVMERNLAELNSQLAAYERISEIVLYPNEFEKTPKKSIKRYLYNK